MMRIHSAEIHYFRSIKKQRIEFSPHVNVLIGINNAGKSNIIKAIDIFFNAIDSTGAQESSLKNLITQDDWFLLHMKNPIVLKFQLIIERKDVTFLLELLEETNKKISQLSTKGLKQITLYFNNAIKLLSILGEETPLLSITRKFRFNPDSSITSRIMIISIDGIELFNEKISEMITHVFSHKTKSGHRKYKVAENPIAVFGDKLLRIVGNEFRFTSPTKEKLTKQPRDNSRNDIANRLYNRHIRRRASERYKDLRSELEDIPFLSGEFRPSLNVDQQEEYAELMIDVADGPSLPIGYFGEGLQSVLNILDNIIFFDGGVVAIEEPENSLHPSGQRYLFDLLKELSQDYCKQIIMTSHSSVFIDRSKDAMLFRVSSVNRETIVDLVEEPAGMIQVLDDLGFKPSYALLSNGVVWVEGPSDRSYIKHWLKLYGVDVDDFGISILPYGGSNLEHISLEDFMMLNRNFILIMDSERKKAGGSPRGYKRKKDLKENIEDVGNYAWITKKRAIDNYVPARVIKEKYGIQLDTVDPYKKLVNQVRAAAQSEGIECSYQKVRDSSDLARMMTKVDLIQSDELNMEIGRIVNKVREWAVSPPTSQATPSVAPVEDAPVGEEAPPQTEDEEEEMDDLVLSLVRELDQGAKGAPYDAILEQAREKGMDRDAFEETINRLLDQGLIYEPILGQIKLI